MPWYQIITSCNGSHVWPISSWEALSLIERSLSLVCHSLSPFLIAANNFAYPGAESGDFGVNTRGLLRPAGVTPGCDPVNDPAPAWALTHQWASAVTTATVHVPFWLDAPGAEHAACEGTVEMLLAVAARQKGEGCLLQGLWVRASWNENENVEFRRVQVVTCMDKKRWPVVQSEAASVYFCYQLEDLHPFISYCFEGNFVQKLLIYIKLSTIFFKSNTSWNRRLVWSYVETVNIRQNSNSWWKVLSNGAFYSTFFNQTSSNYT